MRQKAFPIIIFLVLIAAAAFCVKPAVLFIVKRQIQNLVGGGAVSVRDCHMNLLSQVTLVGVKVQKPNACDFAAREVSVFYGPPSIFQGKIFRLLLKDVSVAVDLPRQNPWDFIPHPPRQSHAGFVLENLELVNLKLNLRLKDLNLTAGISTAIDVPAQSVRSLDLKIFSLDGRGIRVENGTIKIARGQPGDLFIQKFQYGKLKIDDIRAGVRLAGKDLFLESLSGQAFNGELQGALSVTLDNPLAYLARLSFVNLDLEGFVADFDLEEKFQMSGMMSGKITVIGRGQNFNIIDGVFSSVASGGVLVIKNNEFLENIARGSRQPLDIVVASLKNYHYNVGVLKLFLENGNLIFDMALDGETGKRNIQITLHDFNLTP